MLKLGQEAAFTFVSIFLSIVAVFLYAFIFQVTKVSPVAEAGGAEWGRMLATVIALAAAAALVLAVPALIWDVAVPADRWKRSLTLAIVVAVSFAGLLMVIENFSYTMFGLGLKSGNAALVKIAFIVAALFFAILWQRIIGWTASAVPVWPVVGVLIVGSLAFTLMYGFTGQELPRLERVQAGTPRYNVVILSTDGIESEHMSVYGYKRPTTPFLQSIKSQMLVFDDAFSNSGNTTGSTASLLSGIAPLESHVVYPPDTFTGVDALRSLPALLRTSGYYSVNWAVAHFADAREQNLLYAFDMEDGEDLAASWWRYLPLGTGATRWFVINTVTNATALTADALFVREIDNPYAQISGHGQSLEDEGRIAGIMAAIDTPRPFFINSHFMDSHGARFHIHKQVFSVGVTSSDWNDDYFDDAIREFDERVEAVYDRLKAAGKLDDTILVVTSDHGRDWDPRKRVPLMIRFPHAMYAGETAVNVQRLDVAPTILTALGYKVPEWMHGRSLLDPSMIPADRMLVAVSVKDIIGVDGKGLVHKGWVDTGTSAIGPDHRIAVIYCDRAYHYDLPLKLVETISIVGSRSPCKSDPAIDTPRITEFLASQLSGGP